MSDAIYIVFRFSQFPNSSCESDSNVEWHFENIE